MDVCENQLAIVEKFVSGCNSNICYLSTSKFLSNDIASCLSKNFTVIDLLYDFSPFKPFLSILSQKNPDEALVKKTAYSIQFESFLSYFKQGYAAERYDIPLDNEFVYEMNRFIQTICDLMESLNETNYLILNAQTLRKGSLNLIGELEERESRLKGKLVFCFAADDSIEQSTEVSEFIERNSNKRNFLYLKEKLSDDADKALADESFEECAKKVFVDYDSIFKALRNNRIFMAHEQLMLISSWVEKNLQIFRFSAEERRLVLFELALAYYACLQYDKAILHFNDVLEDSPKDKLAEASLYYLVTIFFYKKSGDFAKRYANQLQDFFKHDKSSPYYALYQMTEFQFAFRSDLKGSTKKYYQVMKLLEKRGFINNYISTGLSIPWSLINDSSNRSFIDGNIDKCYALAKQVDNQHLVSKAAHWKGIIHSHYGEGDEAMKWYHECNRIRTQIGEIGPIMNIRNGLSYESTMRTKYEDAYNLVNEVIKNLYNMSDYSTVIDTLKNISYALFYSRHFAQADAIFTRILHYLHLFDMEECANNSFLPSVNDMLIFKSVIELDENDYIHARINYNSIVQGTGDITSEDKPLLYLVRAALLIEDNNLKEALLSMDDCIESFKAIQSDQSHKICFARCEFAVILERNGYKKEAEKYLSEAYELAKSKNFEYYTKGKSKITVSDYLGSIKEFHPLNIDLLFLDEKADREVLLTQLHKRIHDYQFLNKIKATNLSDPNLTQYIKNSTTAIFEYSLAEAICICEYKNNCYETVYSMSRGESFSLSSDDWWELFAQNANQTFSQLSYDKNKNLYFANISQFDYRFGLVILPTKNNLLNPDEINTLNIAISNIQAQVIIFKQNENLRFLSTTDQLSLLNNRHALQQYIADESDKIRRYRQRKSANIQISVAFIDLDNFKYYNDTFGHSAGDLFIACFAKLLKQTCRHIDFIARFGGDEFVIVMVDTSFEDALHVNHRLKENLKKAEFFIPDLKEHLGDKNLQIPENKYLGFSMGICTNFDDDDFENLDAVLKKADQALYYSKEHHKGEPSVWKEISKEIDLEK
ncbi:GGDEF domain-containing protein [uncultured Treponema sp.]|uniref:GGDEF domain-containing protein n=1 Tax=uncultured Treponema sp. TaxID=162155 RepID=UPI0025F59C80|nr:GGDEF domain-containing protein [uncultured Treponema sp.]